MTGPEQDETPAPDPIARIVFWALVLYGLGLFVMAVEDALSHTFI